MDWQKGGASAKGHLGNARSLSPRVRDFGPPARRSGADPLAAGGQWVGGRPPGGVLAAAFAILTEGARVGP